MSEVTLRRSAMRHKLATEGIHAVRDVAVELLRSPGTSMVLAVAAVELLAQAKVVNDTERGLLAATIVSTSFLQAFKPVQIA